MRKPGGRETHTEMKGKLSVQDLRASGKGEGGGRTQMQNQDLKVTRRGREAVSNASESSSNRDSLLEMLILALSP